MYPKEIISSSKIMYIKKEYKRNNLIPIDNSLFVFKEIFELRKYINEFLGELIADFFELETIHPKLACITYSTKDIYGIISKSFHQNGKNYLTINQLLNSYQIPNGIDNLDILYSFFKDKKRYEIFILKLLKMATLDFYSNQIDRTNYNFEIIKDQYCLELAPLFDYSESFNINDEYFILDYPFNYNINDFSSNYIYTNALFKLVFPSDDLYHLINKYPEFLFYIKKILEIDINKLLQIICRKHDIVIPSLIKNIYIQHDKKKKEFVKNLI